MQGIVRAMAACAAFAGWSVCAFAQQTGTSPSPAPAAIPSPQAEYAQFVAALNRSASMPGQLRAAAGLSTNDIRIVHVQSIVPTANSAAVQRSVAQNARQIGAIRRALASMRVTATMGNSPITVAQFLRDNKMSVNSVVAADLSGGKLTLFVP